MVALTGCVPSILNPAKPVSTPTGEEVAADLRPFYSQVLEWERCGDGLGCATATAPLDWEHPADGEIELALVRHVATGDRIGSLLVNPGGPGGSGYEFIADSLDYAVGQPLQERFDVVGFDPRGVGRSSAVACYDAAQMDDYLYGIVPAERGSDEWIDLVGSAAADFGKACSENTGDLLAQVDTVSAARDLDLLRAILGDEQLNYLGYSYGTFLGATYADLYPERVGRLVLDGAIDPSAGDTEVTQAQAVGFENALRAYLEDCLTGADCPFDGSVDASMDEVGRLLASVDASPLRGTDGRMVGADTLLTAIIYPLYSAESWPYLSQMFESVMFGEADVALSFADGYNGRNEDGTYRDNSTEAFRSVNCLDYAYQSDVAIMREKAAAIAACGPDHRPVLRVRRPQLRELAVPGRPRSRRDPRRRGCAHHGRRHHRRPGDAVRVGRRARRPARQRGARELRRRGPHRLQQVECVRRRRGRVVPHRRHRSRERSHVLTWSTRRSKPANIDSRASRIAQARPDATPP